MEHVRINVTGAPEAGFSLHAVAFAAWSLMMAFIAGTMLSIPFLISNQLQYTVFPIGLAVLVWAWLLFIRPRRRAARIHAYERTLGQIRAGLSRLRAGSYGFRHLWLGINFAAAAGVVAAGIVVFDNRYPEIVSLLAVVLVLNGFRLWADKAGFVKTILAWLLIAAIWFFAMGVWGMLFAERVDQGDLMATLAAVGMLVLFGSATWLTRRVAPLAQATMKEMRSRDRRGPVLFLRSFEDEEERIARGAKLETIVAHAVRPYGPFIGIGRPGELRPAGAAREYFEGDAWRDAVLKLMDEAQLIVLLPGLTPGLDWEMQQIARNGRLRKCLFVLPPTQGQERFARLGAVLAETPEGARLRDANLSAAMTLHLTPDWRWGIAYSEYISFAELSAAIDVGVYGLLCARGR